MPQVAKVELFPGIEVSLNFDDSTQKTTYWQGKRFEAPTPELLVTWGRHCTHFFDIGSNYGFFSYLLLTECPRIQVHSFEPNPETFRMVQTIKMTNELKRMFPHNMGLGASNEKLDLFRGVTDSGHSTFGKHPELLEQKPFNSIQVAPFDDFIEENEITVPSSPQWCAKIDVEGFEVNVLRGMTKALKKRCFIGLVVEINPFTLNLCQARPEEVFELLESFGYVASPKGITRNTMHQSGNAFFELNTQIQI